MIKRLTITFILTLLLINISSAQKESRFWYFGDNAGLDFNQSPPVPLLNGVLITTEGCASMSDTSGALLFYTDGITVWDRNGMPMPNGTGLLGHSNSTHSAAIVKEPGSSSKYYIFTAPAQAGVLNGKPEMRFNLIDLSLNGGFGDVVIKTR